MKNINLNSLDISVESEIKQYIASLKNSQQNSEILTSKSNIDQISENEELNLDILENDNLLNSTSTISNNLEEEKPEKISDNSQNINNYHHNSQSNPANFSFFNHSYIEDKKNKNFRFYTEKIIENFKNFFFNRIFILDNPNNSFYEKEENKISEHYNFATLEKKQDFISKNLDLLNFIQKANKELEIELIADILNFLLLSNPTTHIFEVLNVFFLFNQISHYCLYYNYIISNNLKNSRNYSTENIDNYNSLQNNKDFAYIFKNYKTLYLEDEDQGDLDELKDLRRQIKIDGNCKKNLLFFLNFFYIFR